MLDVEIRGCVPLAQKKEKGNSSHVIVGQINVVIRSETAPVAAEPEQECPNLDCETAPYLKAGDKGADCEICKVKTYCSLSCHMDMCKYNGYLTGIVDSIREGEFPCSLFQSGPDSFQLLPLQN